MNKCQPLALGIAIGVLWSVSIFFAAIAAMFGWGTAFVQVIASFYIGYGASIGGAIIGAIWAAVDGFVGGYLLAWIYNKVAK